MSLSQDLTKEVETIFKTKWETTEGQVVPDAEDVALGNHAVRLAGAVLYADLADSTGLVTGHKDWFAAEIYKSYLYCACKVIRANGGEITSFDGDRVMAVFIGTGPNTAAAKAALQINYAVQNILNPKIKEAYPNTTFALQQAVGIDCGDLFIARTGIRGSNDLVWVAPAANYAAKMCSLREGDYSSFISAATFNKLHESMKYGGNPARLMWEERFWTKEKRTVYRSSWHWSID